MGILKSFKLVGEVQPATDGLFVLKTFGKGARGALFEDLHVLDFISESVHKQALKLGKYIKVLGTFENRDNSDTYLMARTVDKAKRADSINLAMLNGECFNYDFFPPAEGKSQFGNLVLNLNGCFVNAVGFRGKASYLQQKADVGSMIEVIGRCRRGTFYDRNGDERSSVDVIINSVKVTAPSSANVHMQELMEAAMAFESDEDAPKAAV